MFLYARLHGSLVLIEWGQESTSLIPKLHLLMRRNTLVSHVKLLGRQESTGDEKRGQESTICYALALLIGSFHSYRFRYACSLQSSDPTLSLGKLVW